MILWRLVLALCLLINLAEAHADVLLFQYDAQRNLTQRSMSEDEYVAGILEAEMGTSFHDEALKAQAVVSRTWYRLNAKRHQGKAVCSLAHCQVWRKPSTRAVQLARQTHGEVLQNSAGPIFFASSCAQAADRLRTGAYRCEISPHYRWHLKFPAAKMAEFLGQRLPEQWGMGSDANRILIKTNRETLTIPKDVFFEKAIFILGNQVVRSPYFTATRVEDHVQLQGQALGHGRGFCQWGAQQRAQNGASYREILSAYFPQASVFQKLAQELVRLTQQNQSSSAQFDLPAAVEGFFITYKDAAGKTLGCSGEMHRLQSISSAQLQRHVQRALYSDPRYPRPTPAQMKNASIFFSLVMSQKPLESIYNSNPKTHGYLYAAGERSSILLPGEARTARWALLELRRQAGFSKQPDLGEQLTLITARLWIFPLSDPNQVRQVF